MDVRVLGPLEVQRDGSAVHLAGQRQQALLSLLIVHAPAALSRETLIDLLWGEAAPTSAANAVQVYVSQLRKALGRDRIETVGGGYRLRLDRSAVDAWRFVDRLEAGTAELHAARPDSARDQLLECLALWRGQAYAGLTDVDALNIESTRLEQLRLTALERRLDIDLRAGRHLDVLGELQRMTAEHPLHERFWAQLIRALYMAGRQSEALEAYQNVRRLLIDELGIEPEPELQELERAVLRQDPQLSASTAPFLPPLPAELVAPGPTFVGRADDLAWLVSSLDRAQAGQAVAVAVEGPPGMGKTRLVAELAAIARSRRVPVLYGAGLEGLSAAAVDPTDAVLAIADDLDELPAAAAPQLATVLDTPRPGCLVVLCYSSALAPLPVRVVLHAAAGDGGLLQRSLQPLTSDEITEVARRYAPTAAAAEVRRFAATVPGEPLAVHEAASAWAVSQAAARVDAAARVLPATQARIETARGDVVSGVLDAQRARDLRRTHLARTGKGGRSPYVGLASYEPDDASFFFGRERLVAELLARLLQTPLLLLIGPSGSGKSSLARAGLLPALAAGALPGSTSWTATVVTPGGRPDSALEEWLRPAGDAPHLVVIDQLEECFTLADEASRTHFGERLASALQQDGVRVVATLRSDFFARLDEWPTLTPQLTDATVLIGPMRPTELRRVIEHPALLAGVQLEPSLADLVLNDCGDQPGVLPLLSTALLALWERRDGNKLTTAAYRESGGVHGAINQLAESTFGTLDADEQRTARRILLRLADLDAGQRFVRSRPLVVEVAPPGDSLGQQVLHTLAKRRLITVQQDTVEVAHEALFTEWPRLRNWLQDDADGRRLRRLVTPAAIEWDAGGRVEADLLRGPRLAAALDFVGGGQGDLSSLEVDFVDASRREAEAVLLGARRTSRRLRLLASGLATALVLALVAAGVAVDQRATAGRQAVEAQARRLATEARSLTPSDVTAGLLLAVEAHRRQPSLETESALLTALDGARYLDGRIEHPEPELSAIVDLPPAGLLVGKTSDGLTRVAPESLTPQGAPLWEGDVRAVAASGHGRWLAVAGSAGAGVVDVETGRMRGQVLVGDFSDVAVNDDGSRIVLLPSERSTELVVHSTDSGRVRAVVKVPGFGFPHIHGRPGHDQFLVTEQDEGVISTSRFSFDGQPLGRAVRHPTLNQFSVTQVSPDGSALLVAGLGKAELMNLTNGTTLSTPSLGTGLAEWATWAPDSTVAAIARDDGGIVIIDGRDGTVQQTLTGVSDVGGLAFVEDGRLLALTRGQAAIFDRSRATALGNSINGAEWIAASTVDDAGFLVADNSLLVIRHLSSLDVLEQLPLSVDGKITALDVTPDGRRAAIRSHSATSADIGAAGRAQLSIVDLETRTVVRRVDLGAGTREFEVWELGDVSFSPDGSQVAALRGGGALQLFAASTGEELGPPLASGPFSLPLVWTPDGTHVLSGEPSGNMVSIDANTGTASWSSRMSVPPTTAAGVEGTDLLAVAVGHEVLLLDMDSGEVVGEPFTTGGSGLISLLSSSDGQRLIGTDFTGALWLWDRDSRRQVGPALHGHDGPAQALLLEGDRLITAGGDGRRISWSMDPSDWVVTACALAGRELTTGEWQQFLPDEAPRRTC